MQTDPAIVMCVNCKKKRQSDINIYLDRQMSYSQSYWPVVQGAENIESFVQEKVWYKPLDNITVRKTIDRIGEYIILLFTNLTLC